MKAKELTKEQILDMVGKLKEAYMFIYAREEETYNNTGDDMSTEIMGKAVAVIKAMEKIESGDIEWVNRFHESWAC